MNMLGKIPGVGNPMGPLNDAKDKLDELKEALNSPLSVGDSLKNLPLDLPVEKFSEAEAALKEALGTLETIMDGDASALLPGANCCILVVGVAWIQKIKTGLASFQQKLDEKVKELVEAVESVKKEVEGLGSTASGAADGIKEVLDKLLAVIDDAKSSVEGVVSDPKKATGIGEELDTLEGKIPDLVGKAKAAMNDPVNTLKDAALAIVKMVRDLVESVVNLLDSAPDTIMNIFKPPCYISLLCCCCLPSGSAKPSSQEGIELKESGETDDDAQTKLIKAMSDARSMLDLSAVTDALEGLTAKLDEVDLTEPSTALDDFGAKVTEGFKPVKEVVDKMPKLPGM